MKSCRIVSGEKGSGKTTFLLSHFSREKGYVTIHRGEEYFLKSLESGKEELLLSPNPIFPYKWKNWYVNNDSFTLANEALFSYEEGTVVLDEVGLMEKEGFGFYPFLRELKNKDIDLVVSIRKEFINEIAPLFFPSFEVIWCGEDRF